MDKKNEIKIISLADFFPAVLAMKDKGWRLARFVRFPWNRVMN